MSLPHPGVAWRTAWANLPATALWLSAALVLAWMAPSVLFLQMHPSLIALGAVGLVRNGWMLLNQLRGRYYQLVAFPRWRQLERKLSERAPKRLFVVVASYKEDSNVTERVVSALAREVSALRSEVFLLFSVGSDPEMDHIRRLVRHFGRRERLHLQFMHQSHGKRLALGQALRRVARIFFRVSQWHPDAHCDLVVLMDGDTEIRRGTLERTLGFFRLFPDLGALTTHEEGHMITAEASKGAIGPWFDLKFAKRHVMMSSHALAGRVLTLTGRLSVFRAEPILDRGFIERMESDSINHWVFGRFRFLMGDDKSTWFDLLASGWRMMYVPDVCVNCLETRGGQFVKLSSSLMFRWFGNLARNNWRALTLGPSRMPFFIWLAVLDQRVSMWTTLLGPALALLSSYWLGPGVLAVYLAWVVVTRLLVLWLLIPDGFVLKPVHLLLQIYDQWAGSAIKIAALMLMHKQSWSKGKNKRGVGKTSMARLSWRDALIWHRFLTYVGLFCVCVALLSGIVRWPSQWRLWA